MKTTQHQPQFKLRFAMLVFCLLSFTMNAATPSDKVLFDFTTPTNKPGWQIVNDDVMGGVSTSRFEVLTNRAVFSGVVSLENNGGFASVRSSPILQDLRGLDGFEVRTFGDGRHYKFTARTENGFDSPLYQMGFRTKHGEWEEHRLPFSQFKPTFRGRTLDARPPLDPAKIYTVGFIIADNQGGPFRLEIEWVKAVAPKHD